MSPTRNGSSALQRFEHGNAFEIRNRIMFDFYPGLPHILVVVVVVSCSSITCITTPQDAHKRLVLQVAEWLTASLSEFKGGVRHEMAT